MNQRALACGANGHESEYAGVRAVSLEALAHRPDGEQKMKRSLSIQRSLWLAAALILGASCGGATAAASAGAAAGAASAPAGDPVFRAMQDELERAMDHLVLPDMPPPYFLSYCVQDNDMITILARYGALVMTDRSRERYLSTELRVGSPEMDNTGFVGSWEDAMNIRERLTEEDDYLSLRHQLWLNTDAAYKKALETLARKQAYLQAHPPKDTLPDFVPAEKLEYMAEPVRLAVDEARWESEVRAAGRVLSDYAALQDWKVSYFAVATNKRYLNSENHQHLKGGRHHHLEISATAQAADGQRLTSFLQYDTRGEEPLSGERLAADIREMAGELTAMVAAPLLDEYSGPVLFAGFASAQLVSQLFVEQLSPARAPLTVEEWMARGMGDAKLPARLHRRVLPDFVSITDEPGRAEYAGVALAGHQAIDDEGVAAKPLTLVREGRLVDLPLGRLPTKKLSGSNGHALLLPNQWTTTALTNVFVQTDRPAKDLVEELRRLCRESGNEFGLLVTRLEDPQIADRYRWIEREDQEDEMLTAPVAMYRVYAADGRREPVRGLVFDEVTIRALRDIAALGDQPEAINMRQPSVMPFFRYPIAIVTPDILVEEMELSSGTIAREPQPVSQRPSIGE